MLFELGLLSVIVVTAYLGPMMMRRLPPGARTYAWMLLSDLGLATYSFLARQDGGSRAADLIGAIAIGGGVFLVVVPPILRDLARRFVWNDRLRLALLVIDARELLQPNLGAAQERELVEALLAVREGRVSEAIQFLRETRAALDNPSARRQIDERIVMTYLYARQWEEAIQYYETSIDVVPGPVSPQLIVEMVRAYCEARALDKAAGLVSRLEDSPMAEEPVLGFLVNRARMVFLAFTGRTTAVESILGPAGPLGAMPRNMRAFWAGVARLNAGDRAGAKTSLTEAARHSGRDRRARELAERTLVSLDEPGVVGPHPMPTEAAELADRLTAIATTAPDAPRPRATPRLAGVGLRSVPATATIIALNLAVAAGVAAGIGPTGDPGTLVIAGANLKSAVAVGEWWRLPTSMFLHVGIFHLLLNMYGLWVLGRLVEQMLGPVRFLAVYLTAGLVGALASFAIGGPGMSAGASGAVFGVLGAAIAELAFHRRAYPERWRRALFSNLVFLTVANVAIGFYYKEIDQSAHLGGLFAGAALAAVLSRASSFAGAVWVRAAAAVFAVAGVLACGYGAWGAATTRYPDTLARYDWDTFASEGVTGEMPVGWDEVDMKIGLERGPAADILDAVVTKIQQDARDQGGSVSQPPETVMPVPAPWASKELLIRVEGGLGSHADLRSVVFTRPAGVDPLGRELCIAGRIDVPDRLAADNAWVLDRILASAQPLGVSSPR
ncbi:MAG TPA: rhomboid family intramembrane serine protease [Kofleriaceae bacterium]|nr:rhomboid family intramembrane serine protease [Kofleriaceae bacterium]